MLFAAFVVSVACASQSFDYGFERDAARAFIIGRG
jgi:hypothetical protein